MSPNHSASTTSSSSSKPPTDFASSIASDFMQFKPDAIILVFALAVLLVMRFRPSKKKAVNSSRWVLRSEEKYNEKIGWNALNRPTRNWCTTFIGTNQKIRNKLLPRIPNYQQFERELQPYIQKIERRDKRQDEGQVDLSGPDISLFLPGSCSHSSVVGGSGTGKTFGTILSQMHSVLLQGFDAAWYDLKFPEGVDAIVPLAQRLGYDVHVFAPGHPESGSINPLDFIKDHTDETSASAIAQDFIKNLDNKKAGGGNPFFESGGIAIAQAAMLFAKWLAKELNEPKLADLLTCLAMFMIPSLAERILRNRKKIDPWVYKGFSQLISAHGPGSKETNVTEAGLVATGQRLFMTLVRRELVPCLMQTNIPIVARPGRKNLYIFGNNKVNRTATSPILAAILSQFINRNLDLSLDRNSPFFIFLDELPSLYLQEVVRYVAEDRQAGAAITVGIQNKAQIDLTYGSEFTKSLFSNCATQTYYNPNEDEHAEKISIRLGTKDVDLTNKSNSYSKGGTSTTIAENKRDRRLVEGAEIMRLAKGEAIVVLPYFQDPKLESGAYRPKRLKIKLSSWDLALRQWSKDRWPKMRQKVVEINQADNAEKMKGIDRELQRRIELIEKMLPMLVVDEIDLATAIEHIQKQGWKMLIPPDDSGLLKLPVPITEGNRDAVIFYALGARKVEIAPVMIKKSEHASLLDLEEYLEEAGNDFVIKYDNLDPSLSVDIPCTSTDSVDEQSLYYAMGLSGIEIVENRLKNQLMSSQEISLNKAIKYTQRKGWILVKPEDGHNDEQLKLLMPLTPENKESMIFYALGLKQIQLKLSLNEVEEMHFATFEEVKELLTSFGNIFYISDSDLSEKSKIEFPLSGEDDDSIVIDTGVFFYYLGLNSIHLEVNS